MAAEEDDRATGNPRGGLSVAVLYALAVTLSVTGTAVLIGRLSTAIVGPASNVLTEQVWSTWQFWGFAFLAVGALAMVAATVRRPSLIATAYTAAVAVLTLRASLLFLGLFETVGDDRARAILSSAPWLGLAAIVAAVGAWSRD